MEAEFQAVLHGGRPSGRTLTSRSTRPFVASSSRSVRNIADLQPSDGLDWARFPWGLAGAVFFVDGDGQLIDYLAQHEA